MKILYILLLLLTSNLLFSQQFKVEKITGKVLRLSGSSENYTNVNSGDILNGDDLLVTNPKTFIHLSQGEKKFILGSNSALELSHIKNVTINDLLLRLAMEELKNVPKKESESNARNTAVYGTEIASDSSTNFNLEILGKKKINGAKQLAESGYPESAIIVAKETYRKHPSTALSFSDRIYFTDLLIELKLFAEAGTELNDIRKYSLSEPQKEKVDKRLKAISLK